MGCQSLSSHYHMVFIKNKKASKRNMKKKRIGECLLEQNLITQKQFKEAMALQVQSGKRLGDILIEQGYLSKTDLEQCLKEHYMDITTLEIDPKILDLIPESYAKKNHVIPIQKQKNILMIAMSDPSNFTVTDDLEFMVKSKIDIIPCSVDDMMIALEKHYKDDTPNKKSEDTDHLINPFNEQISSVADQIIQSGDDETPISVFVNLVLTEAVRRRASDIHCEPLLESFRIRYRIDGVLQDISHPPSRIQGAVLSRIKLLAGMDIAERRLPQDGRIRLTTEHEDVDLRVSSLPGVHGESLVLRILDKSNLTISLKDLGFVKDDDAIFKHLLEIPNGIVLVTGPTGSGKTTTLYAALNHINRSDKKIITVEDPVEYQLTGINQVQVKESIGLTFANALRSILRQSPNVIMIGEIRDCETATITMQAALTGHLVFTTLHTNDAAGAIVRLIDMGIPPYLVASSLQAVLAQRLVRKICEDCKQDYTPSVGEVSIIPELADTEKLYRGGGCEACGHTGYKGRVGIFELLHITESIRSMIFENVLSAQIRESAQKEGFFTLMQDGIRKVKSGVTTLSELLRVSNM